MADMLDYWGNNHMNSRESKANETNKKLLQNLQAFISKQNSPGSLASWAAFWGTSRTERIAAANALIGYIQQQTPTTLTKVASHLATLQSDLQDYWLIFRKANATLYFKIKDEAVKIEKEKEAAKAARDAALRAAYSSSHGYDSDTEERIRGRCSKD